MLPGARRLRVLFADHETRLSGGQQDLLDLVRALDPKAVEAHVALPGGGPLAEGLAQAGAVIHEVKVSTQLASVSRWELARRPDLVARRAADISAAAHRLDRLIRRTGFDLVHTNSMKMHVLAAPAARVNGMPLVWHVRDILQKGVLARMFSALGWRVAERIVCISNATAAQFEGSSAARRTTVVYNGIERSRFAAADGQRWKQAMGATGSPLIGMIGQIAHWKAQDVFIEAAGLLAQRHPEAGFVIVGECLFKENEGEFERRIHARADELGLQDRLVWAGWTDDPAAAMKSFDVAVHASRLPEPFGRVIVEALAAGTPVVVSAAGAGPEIVSPEVGAVIDPEDAKALADEISRIIGDPQLHASMSQAAQLAADRFDIQRTADGVVAVWRELLG